MSNPHTGSPERPSTGQTEQTVMEPYIPFMDGPPHPTGVRQTTVSQLAKPDAMTPEEIDRLVLFSLRTGGSVSAVQLDAVALAAKCFESETAFIVGDATGLGKGRTAVAILRNSWLTRDAGKTGRRALYFSTPQLFATLQRDVAAVFTAEERRHLTVVSLKDLTPLQRRRRPIGDEIIFVSYSMLSGKHQRRDLSFLREFITSAPQDKVPLLVDESHTVKNCKLMGTGGSQQAKNAYQLFIDTRSRTMITFLSATFAANLEDLRLYAPFVGLESQNVNDVGFASFDQLTKKMGTMKDASSLEFLSAELVRSGKMVSRVLAFDGVEFSEEVVPLDQVWGMQHDGAAHVFEDLHQTGVYGGMHRAAHYYGRQLCFFKALTLYGKVKRTAELAKEELAAGHQVVISLMGTGEAAASRAIVNSQNAMWRNSGGPEDDVEGVCDAGVRDTLLCLIDAGVAYHSEDTGQTYDPLEKCNLRDVQALTFEFEEGGGPHVLASQPDDVCLVRGDAWVGAMSYPMFRGAVGAVHSVDENGEWATVHLSPLQPRNRGIAESHCVILARVDELQRLKDMPPPHDCFDSIGAELYVLKRRAACLPLPVVSPLDALKHELGGSQAVAELTGRKSFLEKSSTKAGIWEKVTNCSNPQVEIESFQRGHKKVALLSVALSSGVSLHSDGKMNPNPPRRVQFVFEWPWTATKAMQMLGRTHRAMQVSAPKYVLITSDSGPDQRFAATVGSRLIELGAISTGERSSLTSASRLRISGAGEIDAEQFVSTRGYEAVMRLVNDPMYTDTFARMNLTDIDSISGRKFLNRAMALPHAIGKEIFDAFIGALELTIAEAQQKGTLSVPIETIGIDGTRGKHVKTLTAPRINGTIKNYRIDRGITLEDALARQRAILETGVPAQYVRFGFVNEREKGPMPSLIWLRNARTYVRFTPLGSQKFGNVDHLPMEVDVDAEFKRAWKQAYDEGDNDEPRVEEKRVLMLPCIQPIKAMNQTKSVKLCKLAFSDGSQTLGVDLGSEKSGKFISDDQLALHGFRTEEGHKEQKAEEEKQAEDQRKAEERTAFQRQQAAEDQAKGLPPLLPGWTAERNAEKRVYYAHAASGKTQWTRPSAAAAAAAPAAREAVAAAAEQRAAAAAAARGASVFRAPPAAAPAPPPPRPPVNNVLSSSLASMEKQVPMNPEAKINKFDELFSDLQIASVVRRDKTYHFDGMMTMAKLRARFFAGLGVRPGAEEAFAAAVAKNCEVGKVSFNRSGGRSEVLEVVCVKPDVLRRSGLAPTPERTTDVFKTVRRNIEERERKRKADDAFDPAEHAKALEEVEKAKETLERMKKTAAHVREAGMDVTEVRKAEMRAELAYRKALEAMKNKAVAFK